VTGNVAVLIFAAFAIVVSTAPMARARERGAEPNLGLAAAFVGVFKIGQPQSWMWSARRFPSGALLGMVAFGGLALATVPLTGLAIYGDWLGQLFLASNPDWPAVGLPLALYVGRQLAILIAAGSVVAAILLTRGAPVAWLGILTVVGSLSLHNYGLLLLLPALLLLRVELAVLIGVFLNIAPGGAWIGIAALVIALVAAQWWPAIRSQRGFWQREVEERYPAATSDSRREAAASS
jgi:hypothetical protein